MTPTQQLANQIKEHYSQLANTIEEAYNNNLIDHETYHQHNNYLTETAFLADIVTNQQPNKELTRQEVTQANTRLQNQIDEIRTELNTLKQTLETLERPATLRALEVLTHKLSCKPGVSVNEGRDKKGRTRYYLEIPPANAKTLFTEEINNLVNDIKNLKNVIATPFDLPHNRAVTVIVK